MQKYYNINSIYQLTINTETIIILLNWKGGRVDEGGTLLMS